MLPNDPLLGLAQAKATMAERIDQSRQDWLAAAPTTADSALTQVPNRRMQGLGSRITRRRSVVIGLALLAAGAVAKGF